MVGGRIRGGGIGGRPEVEDGCVVVRGGGSGAVEGSVTANSRSKVLFMSPCSSHNVFSRMVGSIVGNASCNVLTLVTRKGLWDIVIQVRRKREEKERVWICALSGEIVQKNLSGV
jgi:hypothetical protein